jgi:hypothetical protein
MVNVTTPPTDNRTQRTQPGPVASAHDTAVSTAFYRGTGNELTMSQRSVPYNTELGVPSTAVSSLLQDDVRLSNRALSDHEHALPLRQKTIGHTDETLQSTMTLDKAPHPSDMTFSNSMWSDNATYGDPILADPLYDVLGDTFLFDDTQLFDYDALTEET